MWMIPVKGIGVGALTRFKTQHMNVVEADTGISVKPVVEDAPGEEIQAVHFMDAPEVGNIAGDPGKMRSHPGFNPGVGRGVGYPAVAEF